MPAFIPTTYYILGTCLLSMANVSEFAAKLYANIRLNVAMEFRMLSFTLSLARLFFKTGLR